MTDTPVSVTCSRASPVAVGAYNITLLATDNSTACTDSTQRSATAGARVSVYRAPRVTLTASPAPACKGSSVASATFNYSVSLAGGEGPLAYELTPSTTAAGLACTATQQGGCWPPRRALHMHMYAYVLHLHAVLMMPVMSAACCCLALQRSATLGVQ